MHIHFNNNYGTETMSDFELCNGFDYMVISTRNHNPGAYKIVEVVVKRFEQLK